MNLDANVMQIHIEDIIPNRFQPRLNFDEQALKELSDSIKEHGIIQPLVLRKLGNKYEIIAGERRYKAAQMAGLQTVPAVIANIDDNTSAEVALVENVQRKDLTSIEEARSYKNLLDKGYLTQEQLAKKMGLSQPAIANKLRLLNLDEEVQQALLEEKISERHARTLLSLKSKEEQREWLHRIINERLTVRQLDLELKKSGKITNEIPIEKIEEIKKEEPKSNISPFTTSTSDFETLDKIEPITDVKEASTVPDFNITTPNSLSNIENLTSNPTENKYFDFKDNNSFIDLQNQSNIDDLKNKMEEETENITSVETNDNNDNFDSPINISSNNKFFTPIQNTSMEEIENKNAKIVDPMEVAASLKDMIDNPEETGGLKVAISDIRKCLDSLEQKGFKIIVDEIDKDNTYQINIEIEKDN